MLKEFLNRPILMRQALIGIGIATAGTVAVGIAGHELLTEADKKIADQNERLRIFRESVDFLLDNASEPTLQELNKNLEFWRVVRGIPKDNS